MFRKTVATTLLVIVFCTSLVWASDCNDYIIPGRALMFDGTLSGLRLAYETFDNGINDAGCMDCNTNRELRFLHAVTGTAMLVIRDDDGSIDSVFELAKQFEIYVLGNYWAPYFEPLGLEVSVPFNQYDAYEIPAGAPDASEVREIIDTNMIPEIEAIIADLNSISDSPGDRFRMILEPNETRIFFDPSAMGLQTDVEVDYSEVLILKGLLTALKAQLEAQAAYDMYIDADDMLAEKLYGDCFSVNTDLLDPYPDILKVLPTANDSNDGAAILAQARQDWISAIKYYLDAIDYISTENNPPGTDPQDNELFYIDPNDRLAVDLFNQRLITMQNSLKDDTTGGYAWETTKTYNIRDANSATIGQLVLVYDVSGLDGDEGTVTFTDMIPSVWDVEWFDIGGGPIVKTLTNADSARTIEIELECDEPGQWCGAYFEGTMSQDGNNITAGTFEYWGTAYGTVYNLSGQLISTEVVEKQLDLNPIFGCSARYSEPVNPRDLLSVFDEWNGPQPGTAGHGLGDDATLGGIVPDMNQYDWQFSFDLQPGGLFYLDFISPGQVTIDGNVNDWSEYQLVFDDISGDTEDDPNTVQGVDIDKLYMAYDSQYLYGAITFYDNLSNSIFYHHNLYLSYSPDDDSEVNTIIFDIDISGGSATGSLYYEDLCPPRWNLISDFNAVAGPNAVEFEISFPADLGGRFISLESSGWDPISSEYDDEENATHLRIGEVGTISGTVRYDGYTGAPIFVQAYTDPWEPDESLVASTMITAHGSYTLEGIGLGWHGYVRAFTPLFGFNSFDLEALTVQASVPVFLMGTRRDGVDIVLNNPTLLEKDACENGEIDPEYEQDWYSFYAVQGGTYTLDVNIDTANYAYMTLCGRDGHTELEELLYYWQPQHIDWICPVSGRYYVKVANSYCQPNGGTYRICMTSNITCPEADIGASDWAGVEDCIVDYYDLAVLISHWLDSCSEPYWCDDSDFDESESVNLADFAVLADNWLEGTTP